MPADGEGDPPRATRRLVLMRHAKSSWKTDASTDHERPLNKRGRRDAPRVGRRLAELGWVPDVVLSSDSTRTRETFERMHEALGFDGDPRFTRALYHAGVREVREELGSLPPTVGTVLLLGHNPGWEEALEFLTGEDEVLKTGCAALLARASESWAEAVEVGSWQLYGVLRPREL